MHAASVVIHAPVPTSTATAPQKKTPTLAVHPYTVFNLYAQTISLNKLNFFGLGNDTPLSAATLFGMTQTSVGANVIKPVFEWPALRALNLSLHGEMNGRFVNIRGRHGDSTPSIETLYNDSTAPGVASQPGFFQLGEGIRIKPVIADRFALNYLGNFQQFRALRLAQFVPALDRRPEPHALPVRLLAVGSQSSDANGPDHCAPANEPCRPSRSRNLNGSINVRLLLSESSHSATSAVPLFSANARGLRHQQRAVARQLSRLPLPRARLLCCRRASSTPSGAVRREIHRRPGKSRAHARRFGFNHLTASPAVSPYGPAGFPWSRSCLPGAAPRGTTTSST